MTQAYDTDGLPLLRPGMKPSQAQLRSEAVDKMFYHEFKGEDQLLMITPPHGPSALRRLNAEEAAKMIYDKQARLATEDEATQYTTENQLAKQKLDKELARRDLTQSLRTVIND